MPGLSCSSRLTLSTSLTSPHFHSCLLQHRTSVRVMSLPHRLHPPARPIPSPPQGNHVAFSGPTTSVSHHDRPVASPPATPSLAYFMYERHTAFPWISCEIHQRRKHLFIVQK
ncbi:hypothetical protein E2C01_058443 [Portunus trituberculatus]|uniref:Uncharacterized protein n=1 Tax=Portunus trituberculatus TaxID=210409 RepID=A0A5B7GWF9_PORTR|nr:hypothetical protein [Portunus trituberculatus]